MIIKNTLYAALACIALCGTLHAQAPAWQFATGAGGEGLQFARHIVVDKAGAAYVTGTFYTSITLGTHALTAAGVIATYVAKFDGGGWQWARRFETPDSYCGAADITIGPDGNIYVLCGARSDLTRLSAEAGDSVVLGAPGVNAIISSFTPDGQFRWLRALGIGDQGIANSIAVTSSDVLLTGAFTGTISLAGQAATSTGGRDLYLASFTLDGTPEHLIAAGNRAGDDIGTGVAIDSTGRYYLLGTTSGTLTIGGREVAGPAIGTNLLLVQFTHEGEVSRATQAGGEGFVARGTSLAVDRFGNAYADGMFNGDAQFGASNMSDEGEGDGFLVKFDTAGTVQWARAVASTQVDGFVAIGTDGMGNVYALGNSQLINPRDFFIDMYHPDGSMGWELVGGVPPGTLTAVGLAVPATGGVYVCGSFNDTAMVGGLPLANTAGDHKSDLFFARTADISSSVGAGSAAVGSMGTMTIAPNPARGAASIAVAFPVATHATVRLFDATGTGVATLADRAFPAGESRIVADVPGLPAGAYAVVLRAGARVVTGRLVIIR